jgi:hypothetical protein
VPKIGADVITAQRICQGQAANSWWVAGRTHNPPVVGSSPPSELLLAL